MDIVTLAGLVKIEIPSSTIRLCDGGFVIWSAETFASADDAFGAIGELASLSEGVGDEVPALGITFLPKSTASAASLSNGAWQGSRVRFWIAEVNQATAAVVGTPTLMFDGQIDSTELVVGRGTRELRMDVVSRAERLFVINEGNTLSPRFHKMIYPGELGHDNASGSITVAWGTAQPVFSAAYTTGGGFGGGGGEAMR